MAFPLSMQDLGNTHQNRIERGDPLLNKREVCSPPHTIHKRKQSQKVINDLDNVDFIPSNVQSSHQEVCCVCVWRQRSSDQDDHKGKKPYNETCFHNPQSCSWLVIWSNQLHWHQKPTRWHADQGKLHTSWMEPSFVYVQHQPFQLYRLFWSNVEKNAKRFRWRKSHSKIETDDEIGLAMQRKDSERATFYCMRKPRENQTWKSISHEPANWAAWKYGETRSFRILIKLLRMACW